MDYNETNSEDEGPLFDEARRLRRLSERCPGALTAQAIETTREHLLSSRGELQSASKEQLSPLIAMYATQQLKGVSTLARVEYSCPDQCPQSLCFALIQKVFSCVLPCSQSTGIFPLHSKQRLGGTPRAVL